MSRTIRLAGALLLLLVSFVAAAQTGIQPVINNNAEELVDVVFRNLSCFETAGPTFSGSPNQIGTFSNGNSSVGFDSGIIMSNGSVMQAKGPNTSSFTSFSYNNVFVDPDLAIIAGNNTLYDGVVLEFDFTPTTDTIDFRYVFASEEYCEGFNNDNTDVFAFFVTGPGINGPFSNGGVNIAKLPSGQNVDVNSVNHITNSQFYRNNINPFLPQNCGLTNPVAVNEIEYDGMTVELTAGIRVSPCETYHLRMVLADVNDDFFDSAVLLEAGSFAAGLVAFSQPTATAESAGGLTNAPFEGCSDGELVFNRLDTSDLSQPLIVRFNVSPLSTATPDLDYVAIGDSFIIPAGMASATLLIDILEDNLAEGTENIIIRVENSCNCMAATSELFIVDPPQLTAVAPPPPAPICLGDSVDLASIVAGGVGNYGFNWSSGLMDSLIRVAPDRDSTFSVTVTDACQQEVVREVLVEVVTIGGELSGNYQLCNGPVSLPIPLFGASNYVVEVLVNGQLQTFSSATDTLFLTATQDATYQLVSVTDADGGCRVEPTGQTALVSDADFPLAVITANVACQGEANGSLQLDLGSATASYEFAWADFPGQDTSAFSMLSAGTYAVTITDAGGCQLDTFITITQPSAALGLQLSPIRDRYCDSLGAAEIIPVGGTAPYTFSWNDNHTAGAADDLEPGNYGVTVTDAAGCVRDTFFAVNDLRQQLSAQIGGLNQLDCGTNSLILTAAANPVVVTYQWTDASGTVVGTTDQLSVSQAGTYTLLVTDPASNCTATENFTVQQSSDLPQLNADQAAYVLDCNSTGQILSVTVTNTVGPLVYAWTGPGGQPLSSTSTLAVSEPGNYVVRVSRTDNGCNSDLTIVVTQDISPPVVDLTLSGTLNCRDQAVTVSAVPNSDYRYAVAPAGQLPPAAESGATFDLSVAGNYSFYTISQINGCRDTTDFTITADTRTPSVQAGGDLILDCDADFTSATATFQPAGSQVSWTDANGISAGSGPDLRAGGPGIYTVTAIHPESFCTATDRLTVTAEGPTAVELSFMQPPCPEVGGSFRILSITGGEAPYDLNVDGRIFPGAAGRFTGLPTGAYELVVTDAAGCEFRDSFQIFDAAALTVETFPSEVRLGDTTSLLALVNREEDEIASYLWTNLGDTLACATCPRPLIRPFGSLIAQVTVTDTSGCVTTANLPVFVDERRILYAPTAFSPGRVDGLNDFFMLYGSPEIVVNINTLQIFDRWGALIADFKDLKINDEAAGWDGTYAGKRLEQGTYVWTAEFTRFDGGTEVRKGAVHLVR